MIQAIMNAIIGPLGRGILDFYFANQGLINVIFLIWAGLITYASLQLNKIRALTVQMSVDEIRSRPELTDEQIWQSLRPKWEARIADLKAPFILNRWNIWIARPTPENLIEVMRLSPEWFGAVRNGHVLPYRFAFHEKHVKLSRILPDQDKNQKAKSS